MRDRRNKQLVQQEDREAARLRRRGQVAFTRSEPSRETKPTFLLVCEGENTEPSYFKQFRLSSATIEPHGGKTNPLNVVRFAQKLADSKPYDEVWCVFDKDDVPDDDFHQAIQDAEASGFSVAWSNQSFEYWLILHFEDNHGAKMPRTDYPDRINTHINPLKAHYDGKGSKLISPALFNILDGFDVAANERRVQLAINRAGRIHGQCQKSGINPADSESCTTVYKLVKRFMKYR